MLLRRLTFLLWMAVLISRAQAQSPVAVQGQIDLRGWDWQADPHVDLRGDWRFEATDSGKVDGRAAALVPVPGPWDADPAAEVPHFGRYTYRLLVLLGPDRPSDLTLYIQEFLTAFSLTLNGEALPGNGVVGATRSQTVPAFAPRYYLVPKDADSLSIVLTGANFHHRHGGLILSPRLGTTAAVLSEAHVAMIFGGILIGLMIMNGLFQFMLYFHGRNTVLPLIQGLSSTVLGLHFLCLNERWLYVWMGEAHWAAVYKFELASLLVGIGLGGHFFWEYLGRKMPRGLHMALLGLFGVGILFVLVSPIHVAAEIDRVLPWLILVYVSYLLVLVLRALRQGVQDAAPLLVATAMFALAVVLDSFLIGGHIGNLHAVHYIGGAYVLSLTWILSRRTMQAFTRVQALSGALEKANQELARQNKWLEEEVEQRTRALVEVQAKAHQLELAHKKRDLEALSANNTRKVQLTRNLIEELQKLQQTGDPQQGLRSLIAQLRGQMSTEEKLGVLQADLEQVNAEFFERLQAQYPALSKTERELCAYFKLNLSSKDIAALRNTTPNTINVARHRIRKKLGLDRDEELEAFVQQV